MAKTPKKPQTPPAPSGSQVQQALDAINQLSLGGLPSDVKQRAPLGPPAELLAQNPDFVPWLDGDEWEPMSYSPDAQARLKSYMVNAGLYSGNPRAGGWDRDDAAALTQVLEFANGKGISDVATAAAEFASYTQAVGPAAKKPRAPLVNRLTNPQSVRQVVRQTSLNLTGRRLSEAEEARIVQGFTAQESAYNQAEYAAEDPEGGGGSVTAPMGAESYAAAHLENAPGAGARRYMDAFEQIHKSLTGTVTEGPQLSEGGGVNY